MEARIVEAQILPRGHSEVYKKQYRRKDGAIFPVELRTFLIRNPDGQPSAMWAIVRDNTPLIVPAVKAAAATKTALRRRVTG